MMLISIQFWDKTQSTQSPPIRTTEVFDICLDVLSWFQLEYLLPVKLMRIKVFEDFEVQSDPITLLLCSLIRNRHKFAPWVLWMYYKVMGAKCQCLGGIYVPLWTFMGYLWGFCDGGLTFLHECDSLQAKITTPRDIKRLISIRFWIHYNTLFPQIPHTFPQGCWKRIYIKKRLFNTF